MTNFTRPLDWLSHRLTPWVLALALAIPLLWPSLPPLTDLYGHIGRYRIQLDAGSTPSLAANFAFAWHLTGNLGVDLAIVPLAPLLGLEPAVKLITLLVPVLAAFGLLSIAKQVHGHIPLSALLALPLALGHPFILGFLNFSLSMALALNAFALWLYVTQTKRFVLRSLLFLAVGPLLWVAHIFGWGFLGLLCFASEFVRNRDTGAGGVEATVRAGLACLPLAPPLVLMLVWRSGQAGGGDERLVQHACKGAVAGDDLAGSVGSVRQVERDGTDRRTSLGCPLSKI